MGILGRVSMIFAVLVIGAILGFAAMVAHMVVGEGLAQAGVIPRVCDPSCPEAWLATLIGFFATAAAAGAGLFARSSRAMVPLAGIAVIGYAASLFLAPYAVQYSFIVLFFCLLAFSVGFAARRVMEGDNS
jgi:hypothetical protein